ncbi:bacteriocin [Flavobacterium collinsii]|nr:bacteriocin [Flavobacterium collinsii]
MKNKRTKACSFGKARKLRNLKPLSKKQLETIIGGPETSRGTKTSVDG